MNKHTSTLVVLGTFTFAGGATAIVPLIADNDSRGGLLQAYVDGYGGVDPDNRSYNTDPGENEWEDFDLDLTASDGQEGSAIAEAHLITFSSFVGYDEDTFTLDGLRMSSEAMVEINSSAADAESDARVDQFDTMGFRIENFDGDVIWMRLRGFTNGATLEFFGGQHDFEFSSGSFDILVGLSQNGEYRMQSDAEVSIVLDGVGSTSDSYSYSMELVPDDCPNDIDGNGSIGFTDVLAILNAWGPCPGCRADVSGNDDADFLDVLTVLGAWGACDG